MHELLRKPRRSWPPVAMALILAALSACSHAGHGIRSRSITFHKTPFRVVSVDLKKAPLALYWREPTSGKAFTDIATLKQWGHRHHRQLLFAANAGIYDRQHKPLGLYVENGKTVIPLNTAHGDPRRGNFSLRPNGVFAIDTHGHAHVATTRAWKRQHPPPRWATQSGPMLVIDDHINPHFKAGSSSLKWRSGVCARNAHTVVFVISQAPVNFHTFARLFRDRLGCANALYLDGTLSQFYVDGKSYGPPGFMVKPWAGIFAVFVPDNASRATSSNR